MDNHRARTVGFEVSHSSAIHPGCTALVAEYVCPVLPLFGIGDSGIQMAIEDSQRITDIVARGTRPAAILPRPKLRVIDAEIDVAVVALRVVSTGTGSDVEVQPLAPCRVILADDITNHVVRDFFGVDPSRDGKISGPQVQAGGRHFDETVFSVELGRFQLDSVVDAMPAGTAAILAIAVQGPVPNEPFRVRNTAGGCGSRPRSA